MLRGPSTAQLAKCASCFAQDDDFSGGAGRTRNGNGNEQQQQRQQQWQILRLRRRMTTKKQKQKPQQPQVLRLRSLQSAQATSLRMTNLVGGKKKNKQGQTVGERVYVRGVGIGRENNPTITMRTFVRIVIMGHPGSGAAPEITPPDGWRS